MTGADYVPGMTLQPEVPELWRRTGDDLHAWGDRITRSASRSRE